VNFAAILAAAESPIVPGVAATQDEYDARHEDMGVPGLRTLTAHFGGWIAAMTYFGLTVMGTQEAAELETMRETALAAAEAKRILEQERLGGYGLAVLRV
jgi:hypothetical protein